MASKARKAFDRNARDIERLLEIHGDLGGDAAGRRYRLEVLNKSAIVLITAFWEAYCEDLAAEALEHIVKHAGKASVLPKGIKKTIAKELKSDRNELAVCGLSDDGWRKLLRKRLQKLQEERNRRLNTPKTPQIRELFEKALGLSGIATAWRWPSMSSTQARKKLNAYVTLRGQVAHRGSAAGSCTRAQVTDYFNFIKRLVAKTGGRVNTYVKKIVGEPLWTN